MPTPRSSWASDLCHPLPLAAVAVLAVNDHLLKGSGLLPGWLTGKLSDVAGLFFFPLLLVAVARGLTTAIGGRDIGAPDAGGGRDVAVGLRAGGTADDIGPRRWLASGAVFATGAVFAAVKLVPAVNAAVARVWGVMQMDATDLWTLPILPLSAAFLFRRTAVAERSTDAAPLARRAVNVAAVVAAGLASAATSKAPEPRTPSPSPPLVAAEPPVEIGAALRECAALALTVCERSQSTTFVVVEARGAGPGSCQIDVTRAVEVSAGTETGADMLPARLTVKEGDTATFSLSFPRPVAPEQLAAAAAVTLDVRRAHEIDSVDVTTLDLSRPCVAR